MAPPPASYGQPSHAPPGYGPPGYGTVPPPGSGKGGKWIVMIAIGAGCVLLGVALLGIFAAIFVPNFLDALQKAKQKRTVADMRSISTALESYRADQETYPNATDTAQLAAALAAHGYTGPLQDAWKHPLRYTCLSPEEARCGSYELDSGGKDGVFEHAPGEYEEAPFADEEFDHDIVVKDGEFLRYPAGRAHL
jgi:general secretion pathway protein G